jgi:hypothetical protein
MLIVGFGDSEGEKGEKGELFKIIEEVDSPNLSTLWALL